jgi:hypothetical protein
MLPFTYFISNCIPHKRQSWNMFCVELLFVCLCLFFEAGCYCQYFRLHISYRIVSRISVSLGTCFVLNCCLYVCVCFLKPDATVKKPQYCEICLCRDHYFAVLVCSQLIPNHNQPKLHVRIEPYSFEVEFLDFARRVILKIYDLMMYVSVVESMDL